MREDEDKSTNAEGSLSAARGGSADADATVGDGLPDEWAGMLTESGRLTVGRQHFGGTIEYDVHDTASDRSSEDEAELSNQPVLLFAP